MLQYKTVPGPTLLTASKKDKSFSEATAIVGKIIQSETNGGWKFVNMYDVVVKQKKGIIGMVIGYLLGLFGIGSGIYTSPDKIAYVLVFVREA